jgi:DNA primase catalytic subunit
MDETKRRSLSELIDRANAKDAKAYAAIQEAITEIERTRSADDVASVLEMLAAALPDHVYQSIVTYMQANDHNGRQQWPMIG